MLLCSQLTSRRERSSGDLLTVRFFSVTFVFLEVDFSRDFLRRNQYGRSFQIGFGAERHPHLRFLLPGGIGTWNSSNTRYKCYPNT